MWLVYIIFIGEINRKVVVLCNGLDVGGLNLWCCCMACVMGV